jgi:hypothetical protein
MKRIASEEAQQLAGFGPEIAAHYPQFWHDERIGVCGLHRLMFHWTIHMGMDYIGHRTRYCYASRYLAERGMDEWEPGTQDEPQFWHKHPDSSRRQDNFMVDGCVVRVQNGQIVSIELPDAVFVNDNRQEAAHG